MDPTSSTSSTMINTGPTAIVDGPVDMIADIAQSEQKLEMKDGFIVIPSPPAAQEQARLSGDSAISSSTLAPAQDSQRRNRSFEYQVDRQAAASTSSIPATPPRTGSGPPRTSEPDRTRRRRSAMDFRNGPRISELFSNFLHRRQVDESTAAQDSSNTPRTPSPLPEVATISTPKMSRAETPPPPLPPPTLAELGLAMSTITANLAPSHFSTPPTSGTFLAPRYLLLCHAQGLDVLPLLSPPSPEPYALVRRVSFKSVVVMEERGVLIAIAGRRDGVRVYALDELRRVIEWRLDLETRKEIERTRKEEAKKLSNGSIDYVFGVTMSNANGSSKVDSTQLKLSTPLTGASSPPSPLVTSTPKTPRPPTSASRDAPPPYSPNTNTIANARGIPSSSPRRVAPPQVSSRQRSKRPANETRTRSESVSTLFVNNHTGSSAHATTEPEEEKVDWIERTNSSDDEALSLAAGGASGSAALDERTSAMPAPDSQNAGLNVTINNRPPNFRDLRTQSVAIISPMNEDGSSPLLNHSERLPTDEDGANEEDEDGPNNIGEVSLAQILMESRIPDLPPPGTRTQQQPILLRPTTPSNGPPARPDTPQEISPSPPRPTRRRWSILGSGPSDSSRRPEESRPAELLQTAPAARSNQSPPTTMTRGVLRRSSSTRGIERHRTIVRTSSTHSHTVSDTDHMPPQTAPAHMSMSMPPPTAPSGVSSRFIPRFLTVLASRRSEENMRRIGKPHDRDAGRGFSAQLSVPPPPQPKLDYVKLPGTKGSILVKAVETSKKSFLAILCGDAGEKVELFAGTYRTALSLSRTFILPDSPRSLELQIQGDDLVEIYLVFSQNVFGLEPATVRVREVRIGRAERRAARRRARDGRTTTGNDTPLQQEEDTNVSVNIGVMAPTSNPVVSAPTDDATGRQDTGDEPDGEPPVSLPTNGVNDPSELLAVAAAQSAPYTTFQQLSFSPPFPLATLGDDVIIPPSYPAFIRHRDKHENAPEPMTEIASPQFTPPGLPPPGVLLQCRWYYRDPKGVIQGPWKTSLMHSWYRDGLLPLDLPVKRDFDMDFISLRELRSQSVDPEQPFKQYVTANPGPTPSTAPVLEAKPLLPPVSILEQPKSFGPPALFFSSRGGHSTTIVDSKGRPVLKGRFMWSVDEEEGENAFLGKLGDVKRVEAFDVRNRAIIVAFRQGGLEAVDVGDALYRPADESRAYIPLYQSPVTGFNRRGSYVWRIGAPVGLSTDTGPLMWSPRTHTKKSSSSLLRSPHKIEHATSSEEPEYRGQEEMLFLGRQDDDIYLCERGSASFRILRLSPTHESS